MSGGVLPVLVGKAEQRAARLESRSFPPPAVPAPSFRDAIRGRKTLSVIAEFKRRSPSAGALSEADPGDRALAYRDAGAVALSVLTDPYGFGGSLEDLTRASRAAGLPVLMKDFVVSPAQVRAGWSAGASAVLLIARCLGDVKLRGLSAEAAGLGLDPLIEVHDDSEIERALRLEDAILGINNRDLDTLRTDRRRAVDLLPHIPRDRIVVAESGYLEPGHLSEVRGRADAVLIGTALLRAADPSHFLRTAAGLSGGG